MTQDESKYPMDEPGTPLAVVVSPSKDAVPSDAPYRPFDMDMVSTWSRSHDTVQDVELERNDSSRSLSTPRTAFFRGIKSDTVDLIVTVMWISIAAICGTFTRIVLAQLFGEECANPGTVGWLAAGSPLCVTAGGEADQQGGIVYADLPANLVGSFIMGLMQSTIALGLPMDSPIAWTTPDSTFQHWTILHLAIQVGFCGSLTTFSSWNSEMIIIMFGTGSSDPSSVIRAIFGYIIGMETALGSFVLGNKVAVWMHRWRNPLSGKEMEGLLDRKEEGVYINMNLPEFERRYLPNLIMHDMGGTNQDLERLQSLEKWRASTSDARRVNHPQLATLIDIETALLIERRPAAPHRAGAAARLLNWDVDAIERWCRGMAPQPEEKWKNDHIVFTPEYSTAILAVIVIALGSALLGIRSEHKYAVTYRMMVYATLLAPPGALLRWHLSGYNGTLGGYWSWLPAGTMAANVLGSVISIALIATEYVTYNNSFWFISTLRAVKVGFTGSLTTVSTFVSEVNGFMRNPRKQDHAYIYMAMTLGSSCFLAVLMYVTVVYGSKRF